MFIALDKLANQKLKRAVIVVPEKSIGASFHDEPLSQFGQESRVREYREVSGARHELERDAELRGGSV